MGGPADHKATAGYDFPVRKHPMISPSEDSEVVLGEATVAEPERRTRPGKRSSLS